MYRVAGQLDWVSGRNCSKRGTVEEAAAAGAFATLLQRGALFQFGPSPIIRHARGAHVPRTKSGQSIFRIEAIYSAVYPAT